MNVGGAGVVAFLPALDPAPDEAVVLTLDDDGSTRRWLEPGRPGRDDLRLGAGRAAPTTHRVAPAARIGVPGRLAWQPLRLRQVSLEPWAQPVALTLPDAVGVDPRLGRLLLRSEIADGPVTASIRLGRTASIGAGFAPPDGAVPLAWDEPEADLTVEEPATSAWVSPVRAGLDSPTGTPLHERLDDALADALAGRIDDEPVGVAVLGSPRLAPQLLVADQRAVVGVVAADVRTRPYVDEDGGVSLALHERVAGLGGEDPDEGPTWLLRGLAFAGAVELAVSAGRMDLRWCSVAAPGRGRGPRRGRRARIGSRTSLAPSSAGRAAVGRLRARRARGAAVGGRGRGRLHVRRGSAGRGGGRRGRRRRSDAALHGARTDGRRRAAGELAAPSAATSSATGRTSAGCATA